MRLAPDGWRERISCVQTTTILKILSILSKKKLAMNCKECQTELPEYLDGTTAPEVRAAIEAHLATCTACAAALASVRKVLSQFAPALDRELQARRLTPSARSRIAAAARAGFCPATPWWCARYNLLAAAAALLILASAIGICGYSPSPTQTRFANRTPPSTFSTMSELTNALCMLSKTSCRNNSSENLVVNTARRVSW